MKAQPLFKISLGAEERLGQEFLVNGVDATTFVFYNQLDPGIDLRSAQLDQATQGYSVYCI